MAKMKKEIDKDLMYKKLMPSNLKAARSAAQETDPEESAAAFAQRANEPLPEPPLPPRAMAPRDVVLPLMDSQPTVLVNLMESHVLRNFDSVFSKFQCCKCDRCKKDVVALALSRLPPRYKVLAKGQQIPDADQQTTAQVLTAIIHAVLEVRKHPRH